MCCGLLRSGAPISQEYTAGTLAVTQQALTWRRSSFAARFEPFVPYLCSPQLWQWRNTVLPQGYDEGKLKRVIYIIDNISFSHEISQRKVGSSSPAAHSVRHPTCTLCRRLAWRL